jgi:hypothetical protein
VFPFLSFSLSFFFFHLAASGEQTVSATTVLTRTISVGFGSDLGHSTSNYTENDAG